MVGATIDTQTISVLILEDEPLFSEMLGSRLGAAPGLEVVGVTRDAEAAIGMVMKFRPDVVVVDIELNGQMDGIDAALAIKEKYPQTGIVILSSHSDRRYLTSLPLETSRGWSYLLKQSVQDITTIVRAIQSSHMGMVTLDPAVMSNLHPKKGSALSRLTPRQIDVLRLIAQGHSNGAIAEKTGLTLKSIETYIHELYQSLGLSFERDVHSRVKATLFYLEESENKRKP